MPASVHRDLSNVEVRRSRRRTATVNAYRDGESTVVSIPDGFSEEEEREWVAIMLEKLEQKEARRRPTDDELMARALELNTRYLGGHAVPMDVRWSDNQERRWGSCTMPDRAIRLSSRLLGLPEWVTDYVLLHELAHILVQGHGQEFWELLSAYDKTDRARGFLEGITFADENPA
jgi:predicted metal-dependent hydrolase